MAYIKLYRLKNHLISEVETAAIISQLLEKHGDGFVKVYKPKEIIEDTARYYLAILFDLPKMKIIPVGCFAIDRTKEPALLKSVVVHKDYRGIGIGKKLIEIATRYGLYERNKVKAYVKKNNKIMQKILENLGYIKKEEKEDCYKYIIDKHIIHREIINHLSKIKIPI